MSHPTVCVFCSTTSLPSSLSFFFSNCPPPSSIYTLSLHDALPIYGGVRDLLNASDDRFVVFGSGEGVKLDFDPRMLPGLDRKSTRLNSSHTVISYAVFCLKKKKTRRRDNAKATGYR